MLDQEFVQRREQLRLLHAEGLKTELHQERLQEFDCGHLRLVDLGDDDVLLELFEERLDQSRFARADFAGDHDEAVREPDRRFHVCLGTRVVLRQIQERGIRRQSERKLVQLEQFEIHAVTDDGEGCEFVRSRT